MEAKHAELAEQQARARKLVARLRGRLPRIYELYHRIHVKIRVYSTIQLESAEWCGGGPLLSHAALMFALPAYCLPELCTALCVPTELSESVA